MTTRTRTLKELTDAGIPRSTIASGAGVAAWRPSALLSHRTAAWLYGWLPEPVDIEATIPRGLRVTPPDWLRLYRRELSRRGLHLEANHPIGPYVGDFVDEVARIVVEVDGREFHSEPEVFDTTADAGTGWVREGWMALRFAAYDVPARPDVIAEEIIAAVRRRRQPSSLSRRA